VTRHTTLSLFAAAAFGIVMAAASAASGEAPASQLTTPEREQYCWDVRLRCIMGCFNSSNNPETRAACEINCNAQIPPDCVQETRRPLRAARIPAPQATLQARP
jgi:hypothetical protein